MYNNYCIPHSNKISKINYVRHEQCVVANVFNDTFPEEKTLPKLSLKMVKNLNQMYRITTIMKTQILCDHLYRNV